MTRAQNFSTLRTVLLGFTGLTCLLYAALALMQNRPDPMGWWVPGAIGATAAVLIFIAAFVIGNRAARMATDELYHAVNHRAQRHAYWASLGVFIPIAVLAKREVIAWDTGFAVLGTMMGASYLLLFVLYELRMR